MLLYRATELLGYPAVRAYFRPVVTGPEHVPRSGGVIIVANHLSAADEVFTPVTARRQVAYFAKAEYFTQPGLRGWLVARMFREYGHIPVDRADTQAAASTVQLGAQLLAEGKRARHLPGGNPLTGWPAIPVPHRGSQACVALRRAGHPGWAVWHRPGADRR
jgi:1-acyl-sn-glycerol-3-phosphate acyltransferase